MRRPSGKEARAEFGWAAGVFIASLLFYLYTLAPTMLWGDSAHYQELAYIGGVPRGLREHPLWMVMARLFIYLPLGDAAYRANLASATFASLALASLYLTVKLLTNHHLSGLLAAGTLAVSHTFWLHAVTAEVYSLNALFLALCLYLVLRWNEGPNGRWILYGLVFLLGLSLANHLLILTALPGFAFLIIWRGRRLLSSGWEYVKLALLFILGATPFFYWQLLPEWQRGVLFIRPGMGELSLAGILLAGGFLAYQFLFSLPLALVGLAQLIRRRREMAVALGLLYLGNFAFALNFRVPDQYAFYLPSYVVVAVLCGVGLERVFSSLRRGWITDLGLVLPVILLPIAIYRISPAAFRRLKLGPVPFRLLPTREPHAFFLFPPKRGYQGARVFAEDTLERLPSEAVVLADWTLMTPLHYLQAVEGLRPDVEVAALDAGRGQIAFLLQASKSHPVFIADTNKYYEMEAIHQHFQVLPFGYVYRLEPKR